MGLTLRVYPVDPEWCAHGGVELVYVKLGSQVIGAVAANPPVKGQQDLPVGGR